MAEERSIDFYGELLEDRSYTEKTKEIAGKVLDFLNERKYRSRLQAGECFIDGSGTVVLEVFGGLNGACDWVAYFRDLSDLTSSLVNAVKVAEAVWVIRVEGDPPDDAFVVYFGLGNV